MIGFNKAGEMAGLSISSDKTKLLSVREIKTGIMVDNKEIEKLKSIIYLGQLLSQTGKVKREVGCRIALV